jgi:hypothetical protein
VSENEQKQLQEILKLDREMRCVDFTLSVIGALRLRPLLCRVGAHEWADTRKVTEVHHTRFHPCGRGNYRMTEDHKTYPMQQCKHCMEVRIMERAYGGAE